MDGSEKHRFELQMETDQNLKEEVELYRLVIVELKNSAPTDP